MPLAIIRGSVYNNTILFEGGIIEQQNAANGAAANSRFFEVEAARESGKEAFLLPHFIKTENGASLSGIAVFKNDKLTELISREKMDAETRQKTCKG